MEVYYTSCCVYKETQLKYSVLMSMQAALIQPDSTSPVDQNSMLYFEITQLSDPV